VGRVAIKRPASIVMVRESPYSYKETIDKVKRVIIKNGFSVIREELLGEGIVDPDAGERAQHVVYFASMMMISDGLAHDPRMGLFLPGKIIIVEKDGVVKVLAHNPEQYSALFNNMALSNFSEILRSDYLAILQEATL
jgi:cytochrome c oxidase cbb3-type subunit 3